MERNGTAYSSKDFSSDQDVRWCPGCGDYSILKQMQTVLPELGINRKDLVFISGIGCSSRFPYYMNSYGMHSIHGRAPAVATGLKAANPELSVWVITGDGDGLSIGGNHLIHALRRNLDINILLFNNEIYGLTKGQYSPTSELGKYTKSSPLGSIDHPFNPLSLALGADATFVARTVDRDPTHLREVLKRAHEHKGTSYVEIYQNCNVFNDGAFEPWTDKKQRDANSIILQQGQPLVYDGGNKGLRLDGLKPQIVDLTEGFSQSELWVHDEKDATKAHILSRFFNHEPGPDKFPRPFGILYSEDRFTYEEAMQNQLDKALELQGKGNLDELIRGKSTWEVE
ncbi:MAG: 2-oxoacid:ferredoxin oxidoreductase subunit beta [Owenweeksia sp.]|nr:2-oxoacid:ferredoxin oxidoreductase subunit beta [Owenweeksia sp.]MBF99925.1 2-oxoacid:ferredoxin oxidoreductase subunit beta [Owenweeksia sp.]HBF20416.1 2-oxoacid:ferredoxin oxidoreductase subunit beta [Cryomorphaceae bacterium]|tara:strand:+ start:3704 stop:4726 length:1023 start_codon:yes stop_codon:yes gene_type:complete